ncbi:MAG: NrfD/PsrC family molybdoenzyme membrane anchor subunit [bacterium]
MTRVAKVKTVLWFFTGMATVVAIARFMRGLGATTALSDRTPWGLWIGFDVVSGVALAAGGFILAGAVYIFHLEKYRPILRPAILTAFLGYGAVIVGLMFDIGLPWNIWHPLIYWQHHSALFEVAWCVMLYFTVLALEFSQVLFEKSRFQRIYRLLKSLTIPLVIAGIMLSTLHQSSLGTLFIIMPHRIHPLFFSPNQYVLFFVSAVALGMMMVTLESNISSYLYEHKPQTNILKGLCSAARYVFLLYLVLKVGDLAVRGVLPKIFEFSWQSYLFMFELALSAVIPAVLLFIPSVRSTIKGQLWCASLAVAGIILNRINVSGLSMIGTTRTDYFPSWTELTISIGIVSAAALAFFFIMENFPVHEEKDDKEIAGDEKGEELEVVRFALPPFDHSTEVWLGDFPADARRRYSGAFIIAAVLAFTLLPKSAIHGMQSAVVTPVYKALGGDTLKINGNRNNNIVVFNHAKHEKDTGEKKGCIKCHHISKPNDENTPCFECHSDMFQKSSIFNHTYHQKKLKGNASCKECHKNDELKINVSRPCYDCHKEMFAELPAAVYALASAYKDAMHGNCIPCHKDESLKKGKKELAICSTCHP